MSSSIILGQYTQEGMKNIKENPAQLDVVRQLARSLGGEITEIYLTTGKYDMVVVAESPDDATMVKIILTVGSIGAIRIETLQACKEEEYRTYLKIGGYC